MADFFDKLKDFVNDPLNKETPVNDGFPLSSNIPADGNGLPTYKRRDQYTGTIQRNIIKCLFLSLVLLACMLIQNLFLIITKS